MSVEGPLSADTAFINPKKYKFDIIVGMYHDQVLHPLKLYLNLMLLTLLQVSLTLEFLQITEPEKIY